MKNPYPGPGDGDGTDTVPEDAGIPEDDGGTRTFGVAVWLTLVVLGTLLVAFWGGLPGLDAPDTHAPSGDAAADSGVVELTMDFDGKALGVRAHPGDGWAQVVLFDARISVLGDPPEES